MHPCLHIQEILHMIADDAGSSDEREDLVSMALTCHTFYEPAMDVAWRDLPGLGPLIMCLPDDLWSIYRANDAPDTIEMNGTRDPVYEDWDRFRHHARRVRRLTIPALFATEHRFPIDDWSWRRLLKQFPIDGPRMLPSLKTLYWRDDEHLCLDYFALVMQPSVVSLRFDNDATPDHAMIPVLDAIGHHDVYSANIKVFRIGKHEDTQPGYEFYTTDFLNALYTVIPSLNQLVDLHLDTPLDQDTLSHLATLPTLQSLHFALKQVRYWDRLPTNTPRFRSLSTLSLETSMIDFDPLLSFLSGISPTHLDELVLHLGEFYGEDIVGNLLLEGAHVEPTAHTMKQLFTVISTYKELQVLSIEPRYRSTGHLAVSPEFVLTSDTFAPLLRLKNIRVFSMEVARLDLTPAFIKSVAEAWKGVEELDLGSAHPAKDASLAVFDDLLPLAQHCPNLRILGIRAARVRGVHPLPLLPEPHSLEELHIQAQDIKEGDVERIAEVLLGMFPHVEVIDIGDHEEEIVGQNLERLNLLLGRTREADEDETWTDEEGTDEGEEDPMLD